MGGSSQDTEGQSLSRASKGPGRMWVLRHPWVEGRVGVIGGEDSGEDQLGIHHGQRGRMGPAGTSVCLWVSVLPSVRG